MRLGTEDSNDAYRSVTGLDVYSALKALYCLWSEPTSVAPIALGNFNVGDDS